MTGNTADNCDQQRKLTGLRPWQATIWTGMRFSPWWRLLCRNRFDVAPLRIPRACTITALSVFNSCTSLVQRVLYGRRIAATQIEPAPLFVLGHWRTGTTLLHELLAADERNVCPTSLECFTPEHFLVLRCLAPLLRFMLPARRPMDNMNMGWRIPQEDEFALSIMGHPSAYEAIAFPNRRPRQLQHMALDDLTPEQLAERNQAYMKFLRTVLYRRPGRLVLKAPPNTCRVEHLSSMFPEARYVYLVRDPRVVIPSTIHLWRSLYYSLGMQQPDYESLEDNIFERFVLLHERFERSRPHIPEHRLFQLSFETLIRDPVAQLHKLYDHLELGEFAAAEPAIRQYLDSIAGYQMGRYTVSDRLAERIERELGAYTRQHGYE